MKVGGLMKLWFIPLEEHHGLYYFFTNLTLILTLVVMVFLFVVFFVMGNTLEKSSDNALLAKITLSISMFILSVMIFLFVVPISYYTSHSLHGFYSSDKITVGSIKDESKGTLTDHKYTIRDDHHRIIAYVDSSHRHQFKKGQCYTFLVNEGLYNPSITERKITKPIYINNNTDMHINYGINCNTVHIKKHVTRTDIIKGGVDSDHDH